VNKIKNFFCSDLKFEKVFISYSFAAAATALAAVVVTVVTIVVVALVVREFPNFQNAFEHTLCYSWSTRELVFFFINYYYLKIFKITSTAVVAQWV
jgi:hypothetical protein